MPQFPWAAPVPPLSSADGTPNTTAVLADVSPGGLVIGAAKTIYPGMLSVGTVIRLRARGEVTQGTTGNTLSIGFWWGGVAGTAIAALAGVTVGVSATAWPWWLEWEGEVRATGSAGSVKGCGYLSPPTSLAADQANIPVPATAAARTVTLDMSAAKAVTVGAAFSATTGGVSVTCYSLTAELLG